LALNGRFGKQAAHAMAGIGMTDGRLTRGASARLAPFADHLRSLLLATDAHSIAQRTAFITFLVRVVGAAIAFGSQILLARFMGDFEYGIFVFVWMIAVILGNLSCLGLHTAVIRFLPAYRVEGADDAVHGLTLTARRTALASAGLIGLLGLLGLWLFAAQLHPYHVTPLYLGIVLLPMIALGDILDGTARANKWPLIGLGPTFIIRPLMIIVCMLAALGAGFAPTAATALGAAIVATYLTTLAQYLVVTASLRQRYDQGKRRFEARRWFAAAMPIFFIEGFYFLLTNSDVIVVGLYLPPDQVAIYFAAAKTMALVHFVYFAVKAAAAPRFAELVGSDDRAALGHFARQTTRWTFWPSLLLGMAILALGDFILSLFGDSFTQGHGLMALLFAGILAKAMVGPGEVLLTMAGEQRVCAVLYLAVLAVNVALNVSLIPLYGLEGAAAATAAAMALEALLLYIVVKRRLGVSMFIFSRVATIGDGKVLG
jgi:O-antigen/teichoic acid export membrane protein